MRQRQQEMRDAQEEAVAEVREREQKKKAEEAEFDRLRALLGPKLKEWSEQYGKKKDIRALLAGMHNVMWEDSGWKPVSLADLLEPKKVKLQYHKASVKVHPDRTVRLSIEKRFVGQRIFDALSKAFSEFEANGMR